MIDSKKVSLLMMLFMAATAVFANPVADRTVEWLVGNNISPSLIVIIISMLPLIELRGSIPVAILLFNMSWEQAVALSLLGNLIPIPLILLFIEWFFQTISRVKVGRQFTEWLFARTRRKGKVVERYEALGLTIFVGIPLPGTGGWTGAFAAKIFGISFWKSMLYITIGILMAAIAVTALSLAGRFAIS